MSVANKWAGLLISLFLFIILPFIILEETITQAFTYVLNTELEKTWLAGLIAFLLAADIILPVPSSIVSTAAGVALGFGAGTLACWVGMSLGCLLGYWLGSEAGTPIVQRLVGEKELAKAQHLGLRYGVIVLLITRAIPILAETSVITAGLMRVPPRSFFLVTSFSNLGVSAIYSGIGAFAFETHSFLMVFAGAILLPGAAIIFARGFFSLELPTISSWKGFTREEKNISSDRLDGLVEQKFSVTYSYNVYFTNGVFDPGNTLLVQVLTRNDTSNQQCLSVFIDDGLIAAWPNLKRDIEDYVDRHHHCLRLVTSPISVPGGERCKNETDVLQMIYRRLFELHVDRHSIVLAVGGGAVLDAVGFAAATTHRGIRLLRLPTTVLAQNDSGVGVKTGLNLFEIKNFIGTFAPPYAVINDFRFLETLSTRDRRAGVAEAVKVALIKDLVFFEWLEKHAEALKQFNKDAMSYMIHHCAELHMNHIVKNGDPFEAGNVRPLDYGHWAAHKLESLTKHEIRHGEAVAIGIALDTRYATQIALLHEDTAERVYSLLESLGFQLWHPMMDAISPDDSPLLIDGLREFREHLGGALSVTILTKIGESIEIHEMNHREIERASYWLKARYERS